MSIHTNALLSDVCGGHHFQNSLSPDATASDLPSRPGIHQEKFVAEQLSFHGIIGCGGHGTIRLAQVKPSGTLVAVKEIAKTRLRHTKNVIRAFCEKTILASIRHPNIVNFFGTYQDAKKLYIVMEHVPGGDLLSMLVRAGKLSSAQVLFFAAEITEVLCYLHGQGVVYRDLKPENVMLTREGRVKLVDFGTAKVLKFGERTFTLCGTPEYLAPEMLNRCGHHYAVDWWALGVFLHELLTGESPFVGESTEEMYTNIFTKPYLPPPEVDDDTKSLLEGLLHKDPALRLTGAKVRSHPYFSSVDWDHLDRLQPAYIPEEKTTPGTFDLSALGEAVEEEENVLNPDAFQGF